MARLLDQVEYASAASTPDLVGAFAQAEMNALLVAIDLDSLMSDGGHESLAHWTQLLHRSDSTWSTWGTGGAVSVPSEIEATGLSDAIARIARQVATAHAEQWSAIAAITRLGAISGLVEHPSPPADVRALSDDDRAALTEDLIDWLRHHDPVGLEHSREDAWRRD